jgi:alpha-1,3-rhamnosyl/mannosyltransferase
MGQQIHELAVSEAVRQRPHPGLEISVTALTPWRAGKDDSLRVPMRLMEKTPYALASVLGDALYRDAALVHLLDLRCVPRRGAQVVTIHDLPPLRFHDEGRLPAFAVSSARRAAAVICPSEFAAGEVRELLGVRNVEVIANGVAAVFADARPFTAHELEDLGISGEIKVLHVGGATQRKNLAALAMAWPGVLHAFPDAILVLCGPRDQRRDDLFGSLPRTVRLGYQRPEFVARLMASADLVVVPSVYEGFGLPALEAMAAGTPVVAASSGALPEVCGAAAVMVEPDPGAIAAGIVSVVADSGLSAKLRSLGRARAAEFTWESAGDRTIQVYRDALSL